MKYTCTSHTSKGIGQAHENKISHSKAGIWKLANRRAWSVEIEAPSENQHGKRSINAVLVCLIGFQLKTKQWYSELVLPCNVDIWLYTFTPGNHTCAHVTITHVHTPDRWATMYGHTWQTSLLRVQRCVRLEDKNKRRRRKRRRRMNRRRIEARLKWGKL